MEIDEVTLYSTVIDLLDDIIHIVDTDLRIILGNTAFKQQLKELGLETDIINQPLSQIFPFLPNKVIDEYNQVFNSGKTLITEEHIEIKGRGFITETRKIPIKNDKGKTVQILTVIRDITERKQVEVTLRESEEKFRLVTEQSLTSIAISQKGKIIYANDSVSKFYGYTKEEMMGWGPEEFAERIHPEDREFVLSQARKRVTGKSNAVSLYDCRIMTKSGDIKWISMYSNSIDLVDGPGIISSFVDITERKRAEGELREEKERYQMLVEKLHEGVLLEDTEAIISFINPRGAEMLGYTEEELIGEHLHITIPTKELAKIRKESEKRPHGITSTYETTLLKKEGSLIPVIISATPIFSGTGTFQGVLSVFTDITERKKMDEELRNSNETAQALLNVSMDTEMLLNTEGIVLAINETAAQRIGKSIEKIVGTCIYDHFSPEVGEFRKAQSDKVVSSGKSLRYEDERTGRTFDNHIYPILNSQGKVERLAVFARDITEHKTLINELARSNEELDQFASVVSHDLKAPLRGINFLASKLIRDYKDKLDDESKEIINLLLTRIEWMNQLIDGILQYSRAGRIKEERAEINLNELLSSVIKLLAPPEHIHVMLPTELPTIFCEITRITQVFQNLLSNAIESIDKPQGHIKVDCVDVGDYWQFSITDNGSGIEEDYFETIFNIFQTITPSSDTESVGIGLSVVKKIVEMYGGKVWVESKVSKGSTFYF
ncbi:MAG: PAS domain S-box protein, partial [Promethearchaeota archaeon]